MRQELIDLLRVRRRITVVVPVHGASAEFRRCIDALVRNTTWHGVELLVVDDASNDPEIDHILASITAHPSVRVLRNETNLGYVQSVNRALRESSGDVILLNSDTEVTPRWVQNLAIAAHRGAMIATVTPLSNNAGAFSAPRIDVDNELPANLGGDEVGRLITRESLRLYPETPTGSGFCLFIKREVIDSVGFLDEKRFPQAYGEENDLCMRAMAHGWHHVVDDSTFVLHARGASYGDESFSLREAARTTLNELYPGYAKMAATFVNSPEMERVRSRVAGALRHGQASPRSGAPAVLYVLHSGSGGTPATTLDLIRGVADRYQPFLLTSDGETLNVYRWDGGALHPIRTVGLPQRLRVIDIGNRDYRERVGQVLVDLGIELIHVRHLAGHTLDLPALAQVLDIPVVLSFHDFYLVCPTVHLLDHDGHYCGGVCTQGQGICPVPQQWSLDVPHLKHAWVKVWQRQVAAMVTDVDRFVTTAPSIAAVLHDVYPELGSRLHIIEHGRDVGSVEPLEVSVAPSAMIDILVPGNLGPHKGGDLIRRLLEIDAAHSRRLTFHFLGRIAAQYRDLGRWYGPYERDDVFERIREISPRFIGIFAIWPESYSHVLTEAWAIGIPVIATDLGALRDRVTRSGGGWLIDHTDPENAYRRILEIDADVEGYEHAVRAARKRAGIRSVASMAADYEELYGEVMAARRVLGRSSAATDSHRLRGAGLI